MPALVEVMVPVSVFIIVAEGQSLPKYLNCNESTVLELIYVSPGLIASTACKGEDVNPNERAIAKVVGLIFCAFLAQEVTLKCGCVKSEALGLIKVLLVIML